MRTKTNYLAADIRDGLVDLCVLDPDFRGTPEAQAEAVATGGGFICGLSSTAEQRPCMNGCPARDGDQNVQR